MVDDFDIENLTSFFAFRLFWLPREFLGASIIEEYIVITLITHNATVSVWDTIELIYLRWLWWSWFVFCSSVLCEPDSSQTRVIERWKEEIMSKGVQTVACETWFMHKFGTRSWHRNRRNSKIWPNVLNTLHIFSVALIPVLETLITVVVPNPIAIAMAIAIKTKTQIIRFDMSILSISMENISEFVGNQKANLNIPTDSLFMLNFCRNVSVKRLKTFQRQSKNLRTFWNLNKPRYAVEWQHFVMLPCLMNSSEMWQFVGKYTRNDFCILISMPFACDNDPHAERPSETDKAWNGLDAGSVCINYASIERLNAIVCGIKPEKTIPMEFNIRRLRSCRMISLMDNVSAINAIKDSKLIGSKCSSCSICNR